MMPDNAEYMYAAYVAAVLLVGGYVASLISRARAMTRRGEAIDSVTRR
jgi:CcmD family protein